MNQTAASLDHTDFCHTDLQSLRDHIQQRTFSRLHDLRIIRLADGRIQVSAIAHSRFVHQLAEWAVLERLAPQSVDLCVSLCLSSHTFIEVPA